MDAPDFRRSRTVGDVAPFLARSRLFHDLQPDARAELARFARRVNVTRGEVVHAAERAPDGVVIVAAGYVALSVQETRGREKVVELCGPGESFGEESLVGDAAAVTARVVGAGMLIHLPREAVLQAMQRHPAAARCVLRSVSRKILLATHQIGGSATRSGLLRLAGYLLRHAPPDAHGECTVTLTVPKRVVASLLGLSKETFSRLLGLLGSRGLVEVRGRSIHIPSADALVTLCHEGGGCAGCCGCPRGDAWTG